MKLPTCVYSDDPKLQMVWDQLRKLTEARIDGFNLADDLVDEDGLEWTDLGAENSSTVAKKLINKLANPRRKNRFRLKSTAGMELLLDPTDSTYGKLCFVDADDPDDKQIISIYTDVGNQSSAPAGYMKANYGEFTLEGLDDLIFKRNGSEMARMDGNLVVTPNIEWKSGTSFKGILDHANTAERTYTFPDYSGTAVLMGSVLTNDVLPRMSASGLVDSAFEDNGTRGKLTRSAFHLGGTDLGLERHGAGILKTTNAAGSDYFHFDGPNLMLKLGGSTSSFPALKASGATLQTRLGDDSGYAIHRASQFHMNSGSQIKDASDGVVTLTNAAGTAFTRLQFGGTTSSFPAIKRSGIVLETRLADDSGYADLTSRLHILAANDGTNEGGEIQFAGAGAYAAWNNDNYQGNIRWYTGGVEKFTMVSTGPRFVFGGITSGVPALKASGATLQTRLGDDSGYAIHRASQFHMNSGSQIKDASDGVVTLTNAAGTAFSRFQLGGTTSSFPSIRRTSNYLELRLADDSAYTDISLKAVVIGDNTGYIGHSGRGYFSWSADGVNLLQNAAGTSYGRLQFGGTTSSFPAIKNDSNSIGCRFADDSGYTAIIAANHRAEASSAFYWNGRAELWSPASDRFLIQGTGASAIGLVQFGGTTSSFPALKRSSATLQARVADDAGYAEFRAQVFQMRYGSYLKDSADGTFLFTDSAGSAFTRAQLGGTTSSYPALKRDSATIQTVLADDSGFAVHKSRQVYKMGEVGTQQAIASTDAPIIIVTPTANIDLLLPAESNSEFRRIHNTALLYTLTVKEDSDTTTIGTVAPGGVADFYSDGTAWYTVALA